MSDIKGPDAPLSAERLKQLHRALTEPVAHHLQGPDLERIFRVSVSTLGRAALGLPVKRASLSHLEQAIDAIGKMGG
jgi:hypothetical protein